MPAIPFTGSWTANLYPTLMSTEHADQAGKPTGVTRISWAAAEHLGTGLTIGYLSLIVIGMFHNFVRYFRFGVNILEFAEPSDFLLAPLGDPLVMVATVVPIVVIYWYLRQSQRLGDRMYAKRRQAGTPIAWWETKESNVERVRARMQWLRWVVVVLWVVASGLWYERIASDRIMTGRGTRVMVETTTALKEEGTATRPVMLIGTTSRFLFVFRTDDWRTVILPSENVLRIIPVDRARGFNSVRPRMIRAMDSTNAPS